jgi:beta-lactam-binding protein with PASTA domain
VVPRLKGLTIAKARLALRAANCRLGHVTRKRARARHGRILRSTPRAAMRLKAGARVGVVVAR